MAKTPEGKTLNDPRRKARRPGRFSLREASLLQLSTERYFDAGEGAKAV